MCHKKSGNCKENKSLYFVFVCTEFIFYKSISPYLPKLGTHGIVSKLPLTGSVSHACMWVALVPFVLGYRVDVGLHSPPNPVGYCACFGINVVDCSSSWSFVRWAASCWLSSISHKPLYRNRRNNLLQSIAIFMHHRIDTAKVQHSDVDFEESSAW